MVPSLRIDPEPAAPIARPDPRPSGPAEPFSGFLSAAMPPKAPQGRTSDGPKAPSPKEATPAEAPQAAGNPTPEPLAAKPTPEGQPKPEKGSEEVTKEAAEAVESAPLPEVPLPVQVMPPPAPVETLAAPPPETEAMGSAQGLPQSPTPVATLPVLVSAPRTPETPTQAPLAGPNSAQAPPPPPEPQATPPQVRPAAQTLEPAPQAELQPIPQPVRSEAPLAAQVELQAPRLEDKTLSQGMDPEPLPLATQNPAEAFQAPKVAEPTSFPVQAQDLSDSFKGVEFRSAAGSSAAFTLRAEAHPLVRELLAQPRIEPERLNIPVPKGANAPEGREPKPMQNSTPEAPRTGESPAEPPRREVRPVSTEAVASPAGEHTTPLPVNSPMPSGNSATAATATFTAPLSNTLSAPMSAVQNPAPVATAPHPAVAQVEGSIRWLLNRERSGAELQLHPESLGRVTIQLRVEGSSVHARVWATEPTTVPLLQEHRAHLEVSLREQGLSLGSFDLHQGQRGQNPMEQSPWQGSASRLPLFEGLDPRQETPSAPSIPGAYRGLVEVFA